MEQQATERSGGRIEMREDEDVAECVNANVNATRAVLALARSCGRYIRNRRDAFASLIQATPAAALGAF